MNKKSYPIIVVGAGAGGLVIAIGASKAGKKVLLIEKGPYGGDCTNFGCIPSKSLIASSHIAHNIRHSSLLGIHHSSSPIECSPALSRTQKIVASFREEESPDKLLEHGVETLTGEASFINPYQLEVTKSNGEKCVVEGKKIVLSTGSSPIIPSIPGLKECSFLTNETLFNLKEIPQSLAIIGGGPIGCEMGMAFSRLGSKVSIFEKGEILTREEPETRKVIQTIFEKEGIALFQGCQVKKINSQNQKTILYYQENSSQKEKSITTSHLLISVGRLPTLTPLNLKAANITHTTQKISVDAYGRTSQHHIFAIGDASGPPFFTHIAENEARTVLRNLLLPWPFKSKIDKKQAIPRTTFTDPEVAAAGLTEKEAIEKYNATAIKSYTLTFDKIDRAIAMGRQEGFMKIVTKKWSSKILGATIVAPHAGDMLAHLTTAMQFKIPLRKLSTLIHPYPTYTIASRKLSDQWLLQTILPLFRKS